MQQSPEKKLAAIVFTDIVGYTSMMGADERQALAILRQSREIHLTNIKKYGGWKIKEMGDGMLAQFNNPLSATLCARDIQLDARSLACKIRIGIHYGLVTIENGDVFGNGVNIASRLQSVADPGGIFISTEVYKEIEKDCDILFNGLGKIRLKNVKKPIGTFAVADAGFPKTTRQRKKELIGSDKIESIAVLPFQNLSGDSKQQFFVDGMHDALITELSQISSLRVISRTSTLRYKNTTKAISEIGEELAVDAIVEATVLKHENSVRIQAQLIKTIQKEEHLWANSYDRELKNVLAMYNEVVKDITSQIDTKLTKAEASHLSQSTEVIPEAYEAYLKGLFEWEKLSKESLQKALSLFTESTNIDPNFAPAYNGKAGAWLARAQMGYLDINKALPHIYESMYKSIDLDDNISESHFWRASLNVWFDWNWEKGHKAYQKAIEINPNFALGRAYYSHLLAIVGNVEEALTEMEIAIQLDPFNILIQSLYGMVLNYARKYQRAKTVLLHILEENKAHPVALSTLRSVYFNLGELEQSYEIFRKSYLNKGETEVAKVLQESYETSGYQFALSKVAEFKINSADGSYNTPWQIATLYTRAGKSDKAVAYLKKAHEIRDPNMPYLGIDPIFDCLREHPDYLLILKQMKLIEFLKKEHYGSN